MSRPPCCFGEDWLALRKWTVRQRGVGGWGGGLMVFCSLTWGKGGGAWIGAIQFPISSPIQNKVKILRHTQDSQKLTTFIKTISLWRRDNARNVRLYYPYWQYTDLFIFRFVSPLCLRSRLRLYKKVGILPICKVKSNVSSVRLFSLTKGLRFLYQQYMDLFIFRFVSEHCLRSTLRLFHC